MAHYEGVTVKVITNGEPCPMYDDPDADGHEDPFSVSSPPQKYIEAIAGTKFAISATLDPNFRFSGCDAVRFNFFFDSSFRSTQIDLMPNDAGGRAADQRTVVVGSRIKFCTLTSQWQRGDMAFGELKVEEASDGGLTLSQIEDLGRIQVVWQRIQWGKNTMRFNTEEVKAISKVSEKVLKGKAVENSIKLTSNYQIAKKPVETFAVGIPLTGRQGREVRVNILYRSKRTLQMLGCIPRSPSPVQQTRPLGEAAMKPDDPQEELRALRARVAELENRTSNTPQPGVKSEKHPSASKVKREREDHENEVKSKRSRKLGSLEVVDLTAD
ncbi:hypothetical protein XANCAGTX0491_007666 [Xanthoria calcicola]